MEQQQLDILIKELFWMAVAGGIVGCAFLQGSMLLFEGIVSSVLSFFARRNRIDAARKRAAMFSRLAVKTQAEYDRLLADLANGQAVAAGDAVGRACETLSAPSVGAQKVSESLAAKEI